MARVISIHSFRGGTGKSNTAANLACLVARRGFRVAVIDTDIQSPGVHVLFGLEEQRIQRTLNDYLWSKATIEEAAYDVTPLFDSDNHSSINGGPALYIVPSSIRSEEIARIVREGYDIARLNDGIYELGERLRLDYVLIDTHPGVNEETLLSIAMSELLVVVLRPDRQDYLGTAVTVDLARKLEVGRMMLLVNKMPTGMEVRDLREKVESAYKIPVGAVLPLCEEMAHLGSAGLFVLRHPEAELSRLLSGVADQLIC